MRNKDNPHIRIHKIFYTEARYKNLKSWDREIYAICRDRWSLSLKNNYINKKGEIYFYASQEELAKYIGVSRKTVNESFKKLLELELLEKETVKTNTGTANIYYLCEIPEIVNYDNHVTESYTPCNSELRPHDHVTESYTNKPEYNVSIINIINTITKNVMEQEAILKIFIEKKVPEDLTIKILEFLQMRSKGEKVFITEVRALILLLYEDYETDDIRIKAVNFAIASRHNSIIYKEKGGTNGNGKLKGTGRKDEKPDYSDGW
jgi:predicted regulator of amino acid metabolism with ACT domain